jgi:hypothetical protein
MKTRTILVVVAALAALYVYRTKYQPQGTVNGIDFGKGTSW